MAKKQVAVSLRKPPSPEKLDAFVTAAAAAEAPGARQSDIREIKPADAPPVTQREPSAAARRSRPAAVEPPVAKPPVAVVEAPPIAVETPCISADAPPIAIEAPTSAAETPVSAANAPPAADGGAPARVTPEPPASAPEPPVAGPDGRPLRAVTVYLPHPLAERLSLHCIERDRDMSNVVGEALEQLLKLRLGPGTPNTESPRGETPRGGSASWGAGSFGGAWFHGAERIAGSARVERFLQMGRVLVALWRQRPWAA